MAHFVKPQIADQFNDLELGTSGIVQTIRRFLEGGFDPSSQLFNDILQAKRKNTRASTDQLRRAILASQGAQRIAGGAAGKQLNQQLANKIRTDLNREQAFLLDALDRIIANRRFGISAGQSVLNQARNFALDKAQNENAFNLEIDRQRASRRKGRRSLSDALIGGTGEALSGLGKIFAGIF